MLFGRLKETMNWNWVRVTSGLAVVNSSGRSINCHKRTGFVNMLVRRLGKCAIAQAVGCWLPWHATNFSTRAIYGRFTVCKVAHCIDLPSEHFQIFTNTVQVSIPAQKPRIDPRSLNGIFGGKSGTLTGFFLRTVFAGDYYFTRAPLLYFIHLPWTL
jgi:hypothetical protein